MDTLVLLKVERNIRRRKSRQVFSLACCLTLRASDSTPANTSDMSFSSIIRLLPINAISRGLRAISLPKGEIQSRIQLSKHRCLVTLQILCDFLPAIQLPHQKEYGSFRSPTLYLPVCWSILDTLKYLG